MVCLKFKKTLLLTVPKKIKFFKIRITSNSIVKIISKFFMHYYILFLLTKNTRQLILIGEFYLIEHKPKKYQKIKFYEIYKDYFNMIKTYNFKSPIFYDQDQVEYLAGTHLSNVYQNKI